ncbi:MAG: hypothetical protein Ct9H90mP27_6360 [Gammaproteobacteria bacterium]|nr:MAG: hypothetical protein Ct9H90mP27_6360 [Gammaproteobacteria bacterium]
MAERMSERGWTVPTWPKEYGGADLENDLYPILIQELMAIGAPHPAYRQRCLTIWGLQFWGSDRRTKREVASWNIKGRGRMGNGLFRTRAGSDLASLSTRAEKAGDEYLINGRKKMDIRCDGLRLHICISSNERRQTKHQGISLVLVDMDQPGVEVHPSVSIWRISL